VIGRLFWLTVGAAAGVTGYRRLTRLVRAMQPLPSRGRGRYWPAVSYRGRGDGLASFLHDVRDGMDQYAGRRSGPAIEEQQFLAQRPRSAARVNGPDYPKDGC
jgi:hypothetical protein